MYEQLLEKASKAAEAAEVFYLEHEETPVGFEANRLKMMETRQSKGVALRLIKNGRIGFAATTRLDEPDAVLQMALETAQFGAEAKFDLPGPQTYPPVEVNDPTVKDVSIDSMVELGQSLIDRVRRHSPELQCEGGVSKSSLELRIMNSKGGQAGYKRTTFGVGMEGVLIRGTDMLFVGDYDASCHPIPDAGAIAEAMIEQLELAKTIAKVPTRQMQVLFTHRAVRSALLMPLMTALNGRTVLQGASPLGGRLGEQVLSPTFSLWDDATVPFRPGSRLADDEGIPSRRIPLMEQGVARSFLYDLQTAGLAGAQTTGSASRSLTSLPGPSSSVLLVSEGETSYDDMVKNIKDGIIVEQLLGVGQGNVLGGEFSGNVLLGYRVEEGQVVGRAKDTMIAGNVYQALKDDVILGSEGHWVGGSLCTPAICCARISVSSKE
ncbi:MAG: TldD/PmbA family protein [Chloroflexi bacterium]|nr:TldD/PmbA family protein [Chloroflexota bacterium]